MALVVSARPLVLSRTRLPGVSGCRSGVAVLMDSLVLASWRTVLETCHLPAVPPQGAAWATGLQPAAPIQPGHHCFAGNLHPVQPGHHWFV